MAFNPNEHMSKLSGREYLEVKWRLVWFRDVFPLGSIATECLYHDDERAFFKATIRSNAIVKGDETIVVDVPGSATGHGSETKRDFPDYIEKAETKAVGRALAMLGYGTQFAPELEEGERIVDSPVQRRPAPPAERQSARQIHPAPQQPQQAVQWPRPIAGAPMTERQQRRLMGPIRTGQNMSDGDVRAQVFLRYGHEHIHEMSVPECSELMDLLEKGDHLSGSVPPQVRNDPQEANQQGMAGMPEEPAHLREWLM